MNTSLKHTNMTTGKKLLYSLVIIGMSAFFSCTKDNSSSTSTEVTEEDAAEVVAQSITPESGGLAVQVESAALVSSNLSYLAYCGVQKDSTVAAASTGGAVSWSYNFNWKWMLTCNAGLPQQFDLTFKGLVNYDGPRMTVSDSSNATLAITGLGIASTQWTVNGNMTRAGIKISKIRRQLTFTSNATFTATDIKVNKTTKKIVSGTVAVQISGTSSSGRSFSYSGTLTFEGNNRGRLVLATGHIFDILW